MSLVDFNRLVLNVQNDSKDALTTGVDMPGSARYTSGYGAVGEAVWPVEGEALSMMERTDLEQEKARAERLRAADQRRHQVRENRLKNVINKLNNDIDNETERKNTSITIDITNMLLQLLGWPSGRTGVTAADRASALGQHFDQIVARRGREGQEKGKKPMGTLKDTGLKGTWGTGEAKWDEALIEKNTIRLMRPGVRKRWLLDADSRDAAIGERNAEAHMGDPVRNLDLCLRHQRLLVKQRVVKEGGWAAEREERALADVESYHRLEGSPTNERLNLLLAILTDMGQSTRAILTICNSPTSPPVPIAQIKVMGNSVNQAEIAARWGDKEDDEDGPMV
ncbi:hypothetical protein IAT38_004793 [Cryptococcus sp. DSM 104549]